jgi:hypothetical protein
MMMMMMIFLPIMAVLICQLIIVRLQQPATRLSTESVKTWVKVNEEEEEDERKRKFWIEKGITKGNL